MNMSVLLSKYGSIQVSVKDHSHHLSIMLNLNMNIIKMRNIVVYFVITVAKNRKNTVHSNSTN